MSVAQNVEVSTDIASDEDAHQYLTFIMAEEEYGLDILRVQEIRGWSSVTKIPNMPSYVKGVINIRGTIVPIIDLRERFSMDNVDYNQTTVVIVVKVISSERERIMGIVVDAVSDVYSVQHDAIKEAPDFGGTISIDFVRGLAPVDEKMLILLEIDRLLCADDLEVIQEKEDS